MFTSLRLERFKNFKDAELKLGPFTVLIGANASGKSNIRDAFRFLHGIARGYNLSEIIGEKYGEGGERVWTGIRGGTPEICFAGTRSFALTLESLIAYSSPTSALPPFSNGQPDEIFPFKYRLQSSVGSDRAIPSVADEDFWDGRTNDRLTGAVKNHELQVHLVSSEGQKYDVLGASANRPFLHRLAYSIGTNVRREFYTQSVGLQMDINVWCHRLTRMRFFDWSLDAIRQPSLPGQDVLSDNGRNLSSVLYAICQNPQGKRNLLSWIEELTPMDAVDFEFPADPTGRVLATLVEKNGQRITLASASDGTLRFLAFLAALLGPHPSSFLFFEELENGIHPTRLSLLLDLVENQVKDKNIQVVATTHSPELLGRLSKESLEHAQLIYRLPDAPDARIIRILDLPDAERLIREQRAAELLASGWFERTARFTQPEEDPSPPRRARKRTRERVK
jgi:predicted ATPase